MNLPPDRGRTWILGAAVVAAVAILVGLALVYAVSGRTVPDRTSAGAPIVPLTSPPATSVTPTPTPTPTDTSAPDAPIGGDGVYTVGSDIPAGTYRTAGPARGQAECAYTRLRDSGEDPVVASSSSRSSLLVTIRASDKLFWTRGCQPWVKSN